MLPLQGYHVVNLAVNVPGPAAAARLRALGACVTKVEPPDGDPLEYGAPDWYQHMKEGAKLVRLNLKDPVQRTQLDELLGTADLLLTSHRPASLQRLGLGWEALHAAFPRLCHVTVVGYPPPRENLPGHDINYQAELGFVVPPHLPRALVPDMAGAEQAISASLALLLARERGLGAGYQLVSLFGAGAEFAASLRWGLTTPGAFLGGALPNYAVYKAKEGHVAVAVLESHFLKQFHKALGEAPESTADYERLFLTRSAQEWHAWAAERELPITAVHEGARGYA